MKNYETYKQEEILRELRHYRALAEEYYKDTGTKFIPILLHDFKFLMDNCGVSWDDNYVEENEPLLKRFKEIEERYEEWIEE